MQHLRGAEAEQGIDHMARVDDREDVRDDIADANDHHQIWDALIAVFQTEAVEPLAKLFHDVKNSFAANICMIQERCGKIYGQTVNSVEKYRQNILK